MYELGRCPLHRSHAPATAQLQPRQRRWRRTLAPPVAVLLIVHVLLAMASAPLRAFATSVRLLPAALSRDCRLQGDAPHAHVLNATAADAGAVTIAGMFPAPAQCGEAGSALESDVMRDVQVSLLPAVTGIGVQSPEVAHACYATISEVFMGLTSDLDSGTFRRLFEVGFAGPDANICACLTEANDEAMQAVIDVTQPLECEHFAAYTGTLPHTSTMSPSRERTPPLVRGYLRCP